MSDKKLDDVHNILSRLSNDKTAFSMLLEFERILDNVDLYAYDNWFNGELVEGPEMSRYWFTCTFMYPYTMMPDPEGALRLEKYGCKVNYREAIFKSPITISGPESYSDMKTKRVKLKKHKVWLVQITMPRLFIDEGINSSLETIQNVDVDTSDISSAYDQDVE